MRRIWCAELACGRPRADRSDGRAARHSLVAELSSNSTRRRCVQRVPMTGPNRAQAALRTPQPHSPLVAKVAICALHGRVDEEAVSLLRRRPTTLPASKRARARPANDLPLARLRKSDALKA